jgi:hypothetical protein
MEKEFVPYEIAVNLKELGYDKPCFTYYGLNNVENKLFFDIDPDDGELTELNQNQFYHNNLSEVGRISAPTWKQAFKFFRKNYKLWNMVYPRYGWNYHIQGIDPTISCDGESWSKVEIPTYGEAELECLKKLIEIVKNK